MRACVTILLSALVVPHVALAFGGTVFFRNPGKPIFLSDGITKAAGSNYVVELLSSANETLLIATTTMLEGDLAGEFRYQTIYGRSVELPNIFPGLPAFLTIRVWDRQTGTNFDTATLRGSFSFDNPTGGSSYDMPLPQDLYGLRSFCLGNPDCVTNPPVISLAPGRFAIRRSFGESAFFVRRIGNLDRTNSVCYFTTDDTAKAGLDYEGRAGTLLFFPGEEMKPFTVRILPEGLVQKRAFLYLNLTNNSDDTVLDVARKDVTIYDDRAFLVWTGKPDGTNYPGAFHVRAFSLNPVWFPVEYTPTLNPPNWQPFPVGCSCGWWDWDLRFCVYPTWAGETLPPGFYRALTP